MQLAAGGSRSSRSMPTRTPSTRTDSEEPTVRRQGLRGVQGLALSRSCSPRLAHQRLNGGELRVRLRADKRKQGGACRRQGDNQHGSISALQRDGAARLGRGGIACGRTAAQSTLTLADIEGLAEMRRRPQLSPEHVVGATHATGDHCVGDTAYDRPKVPDRVGATQAATERRPAPPARALSRAGRARRRTSHRTASHPPCPSTALARGGREAAN